MEKKITYVEAINSALNGEMTTEVRDRLHDLIKSLTNKTISKKQVAKQEENARYKKLILATLESGKEYLISEIRSTVPGLAEIEPGRVARMVTDLHFKDGLLSRVERKGRAYFSLPEDFADPADNELQATDFELNTMF